MAFGFWTLTLAVILGGVLGLLFLMQTRRWPWVVAAVHGAVGAAGLLLLILFPAASDALATERGVAVFPRYSVWLLGIALVAGLGIAFLPIRTRRNRGLLIAVHATIAICAYTLLLAYRALG